MLVNILQTLQKPSSLKLSGFLAFVLPFSTLAVQPMSESDLEVVSATTGSNILNIFGASQAGLTVDDSEVGNLDLDSPISSSTNLTTENTTEGETAKPAALNRLRTIEEEILHTPNTPAEQILSSAAQSTVLKINEQTIGSASVFETSSEINYKTNNVNLQMRNLENGGVGVSRNLQVDLLKLENLSGDQMNSGRSVGSIYLSDWQSQGDTRIITTK